MERTDSGAQHGSVQLRSGQWEWSVWPQAAGAPIIFRHRDRLEDELRSWTSSTDVTPRLAEELASQPLERRWTDADGLVWTLRLKFPAEWGREERSPAEIDLVFRLGTLMRVAQVPADCRLGELTHHELSALFRDAV